MDEDDVWKTEKANQIQANNENLKNDNKLLKIEVNQINNLYLENFEKLEIAKEIVNKTIRKNKELSSQLILNENENNDIKDKTTQIKEKFSFDLNKLEQKLKKTLKEKHEELEENEGTKIRHKNELFLINKLLEEQIFINDQLEKSVMKMKTDLNTSEENNEKLQNSYDSKQKEQIILQDQFDSMRINLMGESDQKKVALGERDLTKKQSEKTLSKLGL